jgi:hypothetical protein
VSKTITYLAKCPFCQPPKVIGSPEALGGHVLEYHSKEAEKWVPDYDQRSNASVAIELFRRGLVETVEAK